MTFVDYYRADYPVTPPATLPEHYQFYFVFLRENLFDDSSSDVRDRLKWWWGGRGEGVMSRALHEMKN